MIEQFAALFHGREDAYGTDAGSAEREDGEGSAAKYLARIEQHLSGEHPMGVYPMVPNADHHVVKWGCVDLDGHRDGDVYEHARNLQRVLHFLAVTSWVEITRSGHGFHVWMFLRDWLPAPLVRRALMGACQLADAPMKEINPKSVDLAEGQLGNYVRLPYSGRRPEGCQVMLDLDDGHVPVDAFLAKASANLTSTALVERLAGLYVEPVRPIRVETQRTARLNMSRGTDQLLGGLAYTIWNEGPYEGGDRSDTLFHLCRLMAEEGKLSHAEALDLLVDADGRWGKFMQRANGEHTLRQMLDKAWR